jgi:hypothetical protein
VIYTYLDRFAGKLSRKKAPRRSAAAGPSVAPAE